MGSCAVWQPLSQGKVGRGSRAAALTGAAGQAANPPRASGIAGRSGLPGQDRPSLLMNQNVNDTKSPKRRRKWLAGLLLLGIALGLSGCHTLGFYSQALKGQCEIFVHFAHDVVLWH